LDITEGRYKQSQENINLGLGKTIFHALIESDLPPEEKLHSRIWQEGQMVIGAGSDTTAATLTITHFHILDNPSILAKLSAELRAALPDKYAFATLGAVEQLPYLVSSSTLIRILLIRFRRMQ
jgi:cytochrome P450